MNFRMAKKSLPTLAMFLASGSALVAQVTTGNMNGAVKDAKGNPVSGATVTITSPALFQPRVLTTDARGEWRAPLLAAGSYRVVVSKQGFVGSAAENIRVGLGASVRQDLTVKPIQAVGATVEVVATDTTTVDKAETKVATNFSSEKIASIATNDRSFAGAADLTPGVTTTSSGQVSMRGGATNSTLYRINGVDVKNDLQGARTGIGVLDDLVEDIQVVVSPLNARYGRTSGGAINVVTKQGGNTFTGTIRSSFERDSWKANKAELRDIDIAGIGDLPTKTWDITLLGPIVKDRVWFSFGTKLMPAASYDYEHQVFDNDEATFNRTARTGIAAIDDVTLAGPAGYSFTRFDAGKPYITKDDTNYFEGKLTGAITGNHTLDLSVSMEKGTLTNRDSSGGQWVQRQMLGKQITERLSWGVGYKGILADNMFLEARYNSNATEINWPRFVDSAIPDPMVMTLGDLGTGKPRQNANLNFAFSTPSGPDMAEIRGNRSGNVNFKIYWNALGQHDSDMGVEFYTGRHRTASGYGINNRAFYVGGAYVNAAGDYRFPSVKWMGSATNGQNGLYGPAPAMRQFFGSNGEVNTNTRSVYVNDAWTINDNWNVMLGLRVDAMDVVDIDDVKLANSTDITPRLQVKYDPTGDASNVFTLSAARFTDDFITGFTTAFTKKATSLESRVGWTGAALGQVDPVDASGVQFISYADLANPANWQNNGVYNTYAVAGTAAYTIDPDLTAPDTIELSLGYTRQLAPGSKVSLTYTNKTWSSAWAMATDYRPDQWKLVADPMGSGRQIYLQTTRVFNSDELKRRYNGLDIDFTSALNRHWTMQASISYSHTTGNDNGGDSSTSSFRDNTTNAYYSQRDFLLGQGVSEDRFAPDGYLFAHQLLKGRLSLIGNFPIGKGGFISYAWTASYDTGNRFSAASSYPLNMPAVTSPTLGATVPTKPQTFTNYYSDRGAYGRNDAMTVDFKINYSIPFGYRKFALIGDVFVNNLFNSRVQTSFNSAFLSPTAGITYLGVGNYTNFGTVAPGTSAASGYFMNARSATMSIGLKF